HKRAYREFLTYSSIIRRSLGLPGTVKRLAYNIGWMKVDPLWIAIVRLGLMPFATRIFNRVLRARTKAKTPARVIEPSAPASKEPSGPVVTMGLSS
ncbi:MAG: hypothetical protein ACYSUY_16390, partial [Planctomycetota bacterium]